jgi:hypothetical protein
LALPGQFRPSRKTPRPGRRPRQPRAARPRHGTRRGPCLRPWPPPPPFRAGRGASGVCPSRPTRPGLCPQPRRGLRELQGLRRGLPHRRARPCRGGRRPPRAALEARALPPALGRPARLPPSPRRGGLGRQALRLRCLPRGLPAISPRSGSPFRDRAPRFRASRRLVSRGRRCRAPRAAARKRPRYGMDVYRGFPQERILGPSTASKIAGSGI